MYGIRLLECLVWIAPKFEDKDGEIRGASSTCFHDHKFSRFDSSVVNEVGSKTSSKCISIHEGELVC